MIRYIFALLLSATVPSVSANSGSQHSSKDYNDLVSFLKNGINRRISPCDDFYDFVCSNHSSSSVGQVQHALRERLLELVRKDKLYPEVSKLLLSHVENCERMQSNDTYVFNVFDKYLNGFGGTPPFRAKQWANVTNLFEAFLKVVFLSPAIAPLSGVYSALEFEYDFYSANNTLAFYANPGFAFNALPQSDVKAVDFMGYFNRAWVFYQRLIEKYYADLPRYLNLTAEFDSVIDFVNEYTAITANSGKNYPKIFLIPTQKLSHLRNVNLLRAIKKIVPYHLDEMLNMSSLKVAIDESMIDELNALFERKPKEALHFLLSMALLTISYSIELSTLDANIDVFDPPLYCFYDYTLNPRKSGSIFNLYLGDLLIREKFPLTTVDDQLQVRYLIEKVQSAVNRSLISTGWLRSDRALIAALEMLFRFAKNIGLQETVYKRDQFAAELADFSGFSSGDDFIDQIIRLRSSNFRLNKRQLSSRDSYFGFVEYFAIDENFASSLDLALLTMQKPLYHRSYPLSYNLGMTGSVIGHEFFHRFSPPFTPMNWYSKTQFNQSLDCYKTFYTEKMCFDLNYKDKLSDAESQDFTICAGVHKDPFEENIPDIEGARAAYLALREAYGKKLNAIAIPELNFTHEQLFFVAQAHRYCDKKINDDRKFALQLVSKDAHGASKVRVNAMAMQTAEFASAFNCKAKDSMVLSEANRCYMLSNSTSLT